VRLLSNGATGSVAAVRAAVTLRAGFVLCVALFVGACANNNPTDGSRSVTDQADDAARADDPAFQYLVKNFPSREQAQQVRDCITARTGFKFEPLPEDFGVEFMLNPPADYVEEARRGSSPKVSAAHFDCVFELGLEDNYFPPWDHETLRNAQDG